MLALWSRIVNWCLVKYQRVLFILVSVMCVSMYMLESHGSHSFAKKYHGRRRSWDNEDSSLIHEIGPNDNFQLKHSKEMLSLDPSQDFEGDSAPPEHERYLEDGSLQLVSGTHLNMGPMHELSSHKDIFENETEWDLPKHWLPSLEQKHELALHHASRPLDFQKEDVLVFLHIPKTSGKTFNAHLVQHLKVPKAIECQCHTMEKPHGCKCMNPKGHIWLFSRLTTAWPCGVHPSWSDLSRECLNHGMDRKEKLTRKRKFTIFTMLRDPYRRYISEWHNVQRDGQWKPIQNLRCYPLSKQEFCYNDNWVGVTLEQFIQCPSNPGNNRQVRMLADLNVANCSDIFNWLRMPNKTGNSVEDANRDYQYVVNNLLLKSAMHNLRNMPFFGLEEYQRESEYLFTRTFGYSFRKHFRQTNTFSEHATITEEQRERILDLNRLDLVFYKYAKELFFKRLHENMKRKHVFFTDNVDFSTEAPHDDTTTGDPRSHAHGNDW